MVLPEAPAATRRADRRCVILKILETASVSRRYWSSAHVMPRPSYCCTHTRRVPHSGGTHGHARGIHAGLRETEKHVHHSPFSLPVSETPSSPPVQMLSASYTRKPEHSTRPARTWALSSGTQILAAAAVSRRPLPPAPDPARVVIMCLHRGTRMADSAQVCFASMSQLP